ncbi:HNH endonuclease signature motif containing protein [Promicromonospora umidemergens]|nr:HNH endonuclease signature motif containing protein [Promicromonospora umidemergens]
MIERADASHALTTVLEQSLGRALGSSAALLSDSATRSAPMMSSPPTCSWGSVSFDGEGVLPTATVSWRGHGPAVAAVTTGGTSTAAGAATVGVPIASSRTAERPTAGLDGLVVGAGLVEVLAKLEVAHLGDDVLLDVAAHWQEVVSWATAMQSRALGEIARRRSWTEEHNAAAAEISARLRVPQTEANKHLARGAGLAEHPQVLTALHDAAIDTAKADILLRSGNPLSTEEREEAITRYLPQAPDHTRRWLRDKMNQFAIRLHGKTEVTKQAMKRRAVFLDPADNAMAWISANLPATDAAAVWDAIEQAAHALRRAPGATRTLAQARADALVAITTGRLIVPPEPRCGPTPTDSGGSSGNGSSQSGSGGAAVGGAAPEDPALPRTTVPAAGCTCGGCSCDGASVRVIPVKPQIRITVPASMLLGADDTPGHLDTYGPIPADLAAQIAADATWQRLVTDPITGILTDYSTTTYQPGKVLRQAVIARDQTCGFPQCDRHGRWADLDHIVPFDHGPDPATQPPGTPGQTRAQNLQPLCRAHHLAKTHHGWSPMHDPATGITTWTAPTGHLYTRPPTITDPTDGPETTAPAHPPAQAAGTTATRPDPTGRVNNDITSLTDDTRARLGQRSLAIGDHATGAASPPSKPTTGEQGRLFPDEPPF